VRRGGKIAKSDQVEVSRRYITLWLLDRRTTMFQFSSTYLIFKYRVLFCEKHMNNAQFVNLSRQLRKTESKLSSNIFERNHSSRNNKIFTEIQRSSNLIVHKLFF